MKFFGFDFGRKSATLTLDQVIRNLEAAYASPSGITVTPENCLQSPTVQACIRAISAQLGALPIHLYLTSMTSLGREKKERLASHPVARLLQAPNAYQDRVAYWLDAVSWLVRYGNHYAFKARGTTGPIRRLEPLVPSAVTPKQDENLVVTYDVHLSTGETRTYARDQIHHARFGAKDGVKGESPIVNGRDVIALEIAIQRFGASFFGNGAVPSVMFQYAASSAGHRSQEDRDKFVEDFQAKFSGKQRFRALLLPKGIERAGDEVALDNERAQFLQTQKHLRTVIAGFLGVPPQHVGDLERATFNNAEQQSQDFVQNVILPYARLYEAAMERDLLTVDDRAAGVIIRFNLDAALRGNFRDRQEGLKIQREASVINPNEWREREGMNPRTDPGGEAYWDQGPSGQQTGAPTSEPRDARNGQ